MVQGILTAVADLMAWLVGSVTTRLWRRAPWWLHMIVVVVIIAALALLAALAR